MSKRSEIYFFEFFCLLAIYELYLSLQLQKVFLQFLVFFLLFFVFLFRYISSKTFWENESLVSCFARLQTKNGCAQCSIIEFECLFIPADFQCNFWVRICKIRTNVLFCLDFYDLFPRYCHFKQFESLFQLMLVIFLIY